LLASAQENVLALGGNALEIGIIEENEVLKNWYLANGFHPAGTKRFPHLPFTVGFMRRDLRYEE